MSAPASHANDLLRRRLDLVSAIAQMNMEMLRHTQALGACAMEQQRLELDATIASTELVRLLHETETRAEAVRSAQAECENRIAAVEKQLDAVDREIAAAAPASGSSP